MLKEIEYNELAERGLSLVQRSLYRKYISRRLDCYGLAEEYNGRYGKGLRVFRPNWGSTNYCWVEYWVEELK